MSFDAPPPPSNYQAPGSGNEQTMIVLAHILGIVLGFIPPLVIMLTTGKTSARVREQSVEALNFQITVMIAYLISFVLSILLIGLLLTFLVWIAGIVFPILAAVSVGNGKDYHYPFALRLVK